MFDPDDFDWQNDEEYQRVGKVLVRCLQLLALLLVYGIAIEAMFRGELS
jgi:hypothetical protein